MATDTRLLGEPINATARRVISKGFEHKWSNEGLQHTWETPKPTRPPQSKSQDYRGVKFGKMECIGLLRDFPKRWLCRCVCGNYEPRTAKAIRNKRNNEDCCVPCRTLIERKRQAVKEDFFKRHGCYPDQSNGPEALSIQRKYYR